MAGAKYVTCILVEGDYGDNQSIGMTVEESCPSPVRTGLLDQHGRPLYRLQDRPPIGFRLKDR